MPAYVNRSLIAWTNDDISVNDVSWKRDVYYF